MACPVAVFVHEHRRPRRERGLGRRKNLAAAGRGRDVTGTQGGRGRDATGTWAGRQEGLYAQLHQRCRQRGCESAPECLAAWDNRKRGQPERRAACLRHLRLPWRPTQEPSMKRNSQSRTEHQKSEPAVPKNPATSGKAQSNQHHCGSPECDQPAAPGTAMEFSFNGCAVRTLLHAGEPWFVAGDVCAILALANSSRKVSSLDENEKGGYQCVYPWRRAEGGHRQ